MHLLLAITGCSGVEYGERMLEICEELDIETSLVISPVARDLIDLELDTGPEKFEKTATNMYDPSDTGAKIASGSVDIGGMCIIPCSMKTLSSIANGISNNLITRAADVTLKEERKLVLVPRETPLNQIHLKNMTKLSEAGGTILPAMPGFYHKPESIDDLIDFIVGKTLDQFDIEHNLYETWKGYEEHL